MMAAHSKVWSKKNEMALLQQVCIIDTYGTHKIMLKKAESMENNIWESGSNIPRNAYLC